MVVAQSLPKLRRWSEGETPAELAWGPGWWDERWIATYGLSAGPEEIWRPLPLEAALAPLAPQDELLLRLGEKWSGLSMLLRVEREHEASLLRLLRPEFGGGALRCRRSSASDLRRVVGHVTPQPAIQHSINVRQGVPPAGPVLLRLSGKDGEPAIWLTQRPRVLATELAREGLVHEQRSLDLWSVPRLAPAGVIDGRQTATLAQNLRLAPFKG